MERKREILHAASAEFRRKGYHTTGMRDIAAALGVTVGSLYYYFGSKQDLLAFCQEETLARLEGLGAWIRATGLPADQRLYLQAQGHVLCLNEETPGSLAHLEVDDLAEPARRKILQRRDRYEKELRQLITNGVRLGLFQARDVGVAARAILGALNWTVKWYRVEGGANARDIGALLAEQLVRGLLADGVPFRAPDVELPSLAELVKAS